VFLLLDTAGSYDGWRTASWNFLRHFPERGCLGPEHFQPKGRHCLCNQKNTMYVGGCDLLSPIGGTPIIRCVLEWDGSQV
jgi:hypothetical protein